MWQEWQLQQQEKQFAGSPVFASTFQGGLPWIYQESPAASPGWTTALLNTPFPQNTYRDTRAVPRPPASESVCRPCSPIHGQPDQPCPTAPTPYMHSQRPEAKEQDAVKTGKAKNQALNAFRSTHVPWTLLQTWNFHPLLNQHYICSSPLWWTHFHCDWNPTRSGQKNWNLFVLRFSTLLIELGKTHQNPKSKCMLCSFWHIIIISFIYKNQTAPKPQLYAQKKLLVVSKDYRN